jgi:DNA (cytosine-5)-methyltransferase 1
MREAALLQTFPPYYEFLEPSANNQSITKIAQMIGNAVPVALARMIAKSIRLHILQHRGWLWKP